MADPASPDTTAPPAIRVDDTIDRISRLLNRIDDELAGLSFQPDAAATDRPRPAELARQFGMPTFEPPDTGSASWLDPEAIATLPADFCWRHRIVPVAVDPHTIDVLIEVPPSMEVHQAVQRDCDRVMRPLFADPRLIATLLKIAYQRRGDETKAVDPAAIPRWASDCGMPAAQIAAWWPKITAEHCLVLVVGRPGVGKRRTVTRLAQLARRAHRLPVRWLDGPAVAADSPAISAAARAKPAAMVLARELNSADATSRVLHATLIGHRVAAAIDAIDPAAAAARLLAWGRAGDLLLGRVETIMQQTSATDFVVHSLDHHDRMRLRQSAFVESGNPADEPATD